MRVAGLGFRTGATPEDLTEALALAGPVDALATAHSKAEALRGLIADRGLPIHGVDVAGTETPTRSDRVMARFNTGSVAEAAALIAAGPGARLVLARRVTSNGQATIAVAEGRE
jgi:cobalt-precorrin 5A hydrolase